MVITAPSEVAGKLAKALGLPKHTRSFDLRVAVDEIVTIKCEYHPEDLDGNLLEAIVAEYQLVEKRVEPPKQQKTFQERVAAGEIPAPPAPPLCRMVREDDRPFHPCPKCGSSMVRKWWFFSPLKCVHPECGYVDGSEGVQPPRPWPRA